MKLSIEEGRNVAYAIEDVIEYLTDNSCGDPDCCGGPYVSSDTYLEQVAYLATLGIEIGD